jgi:hypothetical protein
MNKLIYTCVAKDGTKTTVRTYEEAERVKAKGGYYKVTYEPIVNNFKVAAGRYAKLKDKF